MITPAECAARLRRVQAARRAATLTVIRKWLPWARQRAVTFYMLPGPNGPVARTKLRHRSGRLGRATQTVGPLVRIQGDGMREVRFGLKRPGVAYSDIHEFGGRTGAHVIYPRRAKALRFKIGRSVVFARRVSHPGSRIPPRPALRPSMDDTTKRMAPDLRRDTKAATRRVLGLA